MQILYCGTDLPQTTRLVSVSMPAKTWDDLPRQYLHVSHTQLATMCLLSCNLMTVQISGSIIAALHLSHDIIPTGAIFSACLRDSGPVNF